MAHHLDREFATPATKQILKELGRLDQAGTISRDRLDREFQHRCVVRRDAREADPRLDISDAAIPNGPRIAVGEAE